MELREKIADLILNNYLFDPYSSKDGDNVARELAEQILALIKEAGYVKPADETKEKKNG